MATVIVPAGEIPSATAVAAAAAATALVVVQVFTDDYIIRRFSRNR